VEDLTANSTNKNAWDGIRWKKIIGGKCRHVAVARADDDGDLAALLADDFTQKNIH
jgi:hypothetical protein